MTLPNFFIVGAPKAGTDDLYYQLDRHPQIYMSPLKEPCFFSSEVRAENFEESLQAHARVATESTREYLKAGAPKKRFGGIVTSLEDYERLFLRVQGERAIGEGSVCYLWSTSAAAAIAQRIPRARIIIVLMDPAERAFHQYLKSFSDGNVSHSFHTHLELAFREKGEKMSIYSPFLAFGEYAEQVQRYMARFPQEQIHISFYEDREGDPSGWFKGILTFLEVENSFVPGPVEVPSKPHFAHANLLGKSINQLRFRPALGKIVSSRWKSRIKEFLYQSDATPAFAQEDRAGLVRFYRDDIFKLQEIVGRDLSAWLRY